MCMKLVLYLGITTALYIRMCAQNSSIMKSVLVDWVLVDKHQCAHTAFARWTKLPDWVGACSLRSPFQLRADDTARCALPSNGPGPAETVLGGAITRHGQLLAASEASHMQVQHIYTSTSYTP
ncbi:hypothetical protein FN846DRAFT_932453 [Sphaerosporella brunnea]|uniref:Secreted protein n=1 Tax=Sphaerosporella brunnea TaxID=1250544 RepID=A0A5J5F7R7_9PEZI|nr:hypothetical protein FN846DRAFT_932453 [Sphaerosporella brunnea]